MRKHRYRVYKCTYCDGFGLSRDFYTYLLKDCVFCRGEGVILKSDYRKEARA